MADDMTFNKNIKDILDAWEDGLITRQERNLKILELVLMDLHVEATNCYEKIAEIERVIKS